MAETNLIININSGTTAAGGSDETLRITVNDTPDSNLINSPEF